MTGDYTETIQLGATIAAWTVVTLSADGKYDNCTNKTTRPMYITAEAGVDGDYVNAYPPQPGTIKAMFGAACAVDSAVGAGTGGKLVDAGADTTFDGGWVCGHIMDTAAGADGDIVDIRFAPMYTADASASEG